MAYKGAVKVQKVMVQPINLIFRYLQNRSRVQVWVYENVTTRIEGHIVGFDEYMNLVLDDAEEYNLKTKNRKELGRIMMKGDNITLIQSLDSGKYTKSFVDRCIAYVGENANECVQTNSFLTLPKDALIKLISSDSFALEEEDVWRAVLNWAKYQAGVTQPTAHWTEEERVRVGQHLSGVINHVRLLLIDSQVFAEEVEPTGAVPIELSLERYRYAALPNKFRERSEDKKLQPRVSLSFFAGSQILVQDKISFQRVLNSWYGVPKQSWRLHYRASTHGFSAEAFHRHCDGIAPLFVIALGTRGDICGGFTDVAWNKTSSKGHYIPSDKAFLFSLVNSMNYPPMKFNIIKKPFAICYHKDCGPIFGAGADLLISNNCDMNKDSYSNLPHSYDGENASTSVLMSDYSFTVVDYEVFTLGSK
ncbi:hypothetical protein RUM43_013297 [Polyplax serrata]|uniref:Probable small nuclear ribonucleoprotein E n=1 Tax=Polyplax serrata TaxID=468196 RepID=A0AAN8PHP0_POLSC